MGADFVGGADGDEDARRHAVEQLDRRDREHRSSPSLSIIPACVSSPAPRLPSRTSQATSRPTGGLLFSDTFADDTIGILVDGIYTEHSTTTNRDFVSGWEGGKFAPCQLTAICTPGELADVNQTIVGWWQQQYGAEQSQVIRRAHRRTHRVPVAALRQHARHDRRQLTRARRSRPTTYGFGLWFGINDLRSVQLGLERHGDRLIARPARRWISTAARRTASASTNQIGLNLNFDLGPPELRGRCLLREERQNPNGEGFDGRRHRLRRHARLATWACA